MVVDLAGRFGLGPRAHGSLDWDESSVGSWPDGNAVGEGVQDERYWAHLLLWGKGKVTLQVLPAENGFAPLFGLAYYCTGPQAGLLPCFPPQRTARVYL